MTDPGSTPFGAGRASGERPATQPDLTEADLTDVDRIRAAVLGCPDVAGVLAGPLGEIASYLPGRTVPGVRVDDDHVEVHVIARYGPPLRAVADQIGDSVRSLLDGRPLSVAVDDILLPGETLEQDDDVTAAPHPPEPSGTPEPPRDS